MLNIEIRTVPHKSQRYPTVGDWFWRGEKLVILVSGMGNWRYEAAVGLHEYIEALECRKNGISQHEVDNFDQTFKGEGEPGDDALAPYRHEHFNATTLERLFTM